MREMNCQPGPSRNVALPSAAANRSSRGESASQLDRARHL